MIWMQKTLVPKRLVCSLVQAGGRLWEGCSLELVWFRARAVAHVLDLRCMLTESEGLQGHPGVHGECITLCCGTYGELAASGRVHGEREAKYKSKDSCLFSWTHMSNAPPTPTPHSNAQQLQAQFQPRLACGTGEKSHLLWKSLLMLSTKGGFSGGIIAPGTQVKL